MVPGSPVDRALRVLAAPDGADDLEVVLAPLDGPEAGAMLDLVVAHRLHAALVDALERAGVEQEKRVVELAADDQVVRLRLQRALLAAAGVLDEADIPWLVFKGATIASVMSRPELRTYNDLDLLVAASRFEDAIDALAEVGIVEVNTNWDPYVRHRVGEVPMAGGGVTVDLHWHVVGLRRERRNIRFEPAAMLSRRRWSTIHGRELPLFSLEDQLLHLAVHSALSGATRLDQLRDIAAVVAADPVDWVWFTAAAREAGVSRLVGHALDRSAGVLGAGVPAEVRVELAGARSLELRRRFDGGSVGSLRGLAVAWRRDSAWSSARAARVRLVDSLPRFGRRLVGWDFASPDSHLYFGRPSGGAAARQEFLRGVEVWD